MTASPKPLTPEELAEGRRRFETSKTCINSEQWGWHAFRDWAQANADRLLAAAERLAELEQQLAEAQAVIVFDRHPDSDFSWKRPPFYVTAVEAAHAASHSKESTP